MAEQTLLRNRAYKDISLTMGRNPVTHDIIAVTGADAIKRSIKNILYTHAGEIPFLPYFGSRVRHLLFEPIDPITTALLESEIISTLEAFEPRALLNAVDIRTSLDEQRYDITITFQLNNLASPVTVSLFLSRLR